MMHTPSTRRAGLVVAALLLCAGVLVLQAGPAAAATTASFSTTSNWDTGYEGRYTIANTGPAAITGWQVEFDLPASTTVGTFWDALMTHTGNHYTFTNRDYNATVAVGASVTFGFVAAGTTPPANCRLNGAACGGGSAPTTTRPPGATITTTRPLVTTTPPPPPPDGTALKVAPYVDMGAFPTPTLADIARTTGLRGFSLAFVTSVGCRASWFNAFDPRQGFARADIDAVRALGGDVTISFGGASGIELAQACTDVASLTAEYQAVVTAYALRNVDFDIEGAAVAEPASIARRSAAIAALQRGANPGLRVSLTLPVLPEGLTADGPNVVRSARDAGVDVGMVNLMAMDYSRDGDYGAFAVQAAQSTFAQLKTLYPTRTDAQLWAMVGVTPMLGQNDDGHIYDQTDARQLVTFANGQHLGGLAF
jgi:Cellulose binding domain